MINSIYSPTGPAMAWAIDLLSLPKCCLLVAVDLFSRFIVAIPLHKEATSEHLWDLFSIHIMGVHGRPRVVIADNAPNISGNSIQQLCAMLSIELRTTPSYSPRSNLTELANKHILLALRLYHANYNIPYNQWKVSLPSILSGINFAPFAGILGTKHGISPAKLFYVNRDSLDPSKQGDMPYLGHVYKDYHAYVKHHIDAPVLILGLAPGLRGANATGRPFTGDFAGQVLYDALLACGLADGPYNAHKDDGLTLRQVRVSNAVRCVPPQNKPTSTEIATCRPFLSQELSQMKNLRLILSLGRISHETCLRHFGLKLSSYPFSHNSLHTLPSGIKLLSSYHCSRYNIQTKRLSQDMFLAVCLRLKQEAGLI